MSIKDIIIISLVSAVLLGGCSYDPYRKRPRNCVTTKGTAVMCSRPIRLKDLTGQPSGRVMSALGKADGEFLVIKGKKYLHFDIHSYGGGAVYVLYDRHHKAITALIYPEELEFKEPDILSFLWAEEVTVPPRKDRDKDGRQVLIWDNDPDFFTFAAFADLNRPGKTHFIILDADAALDPGHRHRTDPAEDRNYRFEVLRRLTIVWRDMRVEYFYLAIAVGFMAVLGSMRSGPEREILARLPGALFALVFRGSTEEFEDYNLKAVLKHCLGWFIFGVVITIVVIALF